MTNRSDTSEESQINKFILIEYFKDRPGLYFGILKESSYNASCGHMRFKGNYIECAEKFSQLSHLKFKEHKDFPIFNIKKDSPPKFKWTTVMDQFEKSYRMSPYEWFKKETFNSDISKY